jgi:hypothetical protein
MPVYKIVPYADGRLLHPLEPLVEDREGIRHVKEGVGLFLGKYPVDPVVNLFSFCGIKGASPLKEKPVDLGVTVGNEIEFSFLCL